MLTRGVQRTSVDPASETPMVLRVSGGSSIIGDDLSQEDITVSIEEALRLNASCVAMSIFVGSKYEYQTIVNLGKLVNEAEKYGMPVLAVTAVGKELGKDAIDMVRKGGTVMMFGVPSKDAMINLDMSKVYSKEITLVTSYAASDDDTKTALELIESSEIDVKQLITHTYSISDTQKAFDHAKTGDKAMKIIITK